MKTMKIMSFNLRVDIPSDELNAWSYRSEKVCGIIKKHAPVVVGTQEGIDYMINDITSNLVGYYHIGEGRESDKSGELTAILYKKDALKCIENGQFWLSETPEAPGSKSWDTEYPRTCTWGKFEHLNDNSVFYVLNTHLDHISQEARMNGVRMIMDFIQNELDGEYPIFLMGDFNVTPEDEVIEYLSKFDSLQSAYETIEGEIGITYHDFKGGISGDPIDYIYTTKEFIIEKTIIDREEFSGSFPSDHYPLIISVTTP